MPTRTRSLAATAVLIALSLLPASCGDGTTGPDGPCYTVTDLFASGMAAADTMAARTAFDAYLTHLDETNGYPVFGWTALEYRRSAGVERYADRFYWGIVAWGKQANADSSETTMFRVRQDGTVVLMLGCI